MYEEALKAIEARAEAARDVTKSAHQRVAEGKPDVEIGDMLLALANSADDVPKLLAEVRRLRAEFNGLAGDVIRRLLDDRNKIGDALTIANDARNAERARIVAMVRERAEAARSRERQTDSYYAAGAADALAAIADSIASADGAERGGQGGES
jgi:hypothetical protein